MRIHLALGLGEERQAPAVAERAGGGADGKRARIPQRIEQARRATELPDPLGAPREMVLLLARGLVQRLARRAIARRQRLALVERLRAHFASVVDPHQCRGVVALRRAQLNLGNGRPRRGPGGLRPPAYPALSAVEFTEATPVELPLYSH